MDRKSFLRSGARWMLLGLLAGMVLFLVKKQRISPDFACAENEFCKNCSKFGSCNLPQATEQS